MCTSKDDTALIVGLGSIGLLMGEGLKAMGYKVYGCDLIPERIELAKKWVLNRLISALKLTGCL